MMLLSQALRDRLLSGRDWADQFGQIATLLKTAAAPRAAEPAHADRAGWPRTP